MNEKLTKLRQKLTEKQAKFVQLIRSGQDRGNAYINAGYRAETREQAQMNASRLLTKNDKVIEYFEALRADDDRKVNISRTQQLRKLDRAYEVAKQKENPSGMVAAIKEQNEMLGYHREQAPNLEREQARKEFLESERREVEELARLRTAQLSGIDIRTLLPPLGEVRRKDDESN